MLEAARSEADVDVRRGIAEDINRRFAEQCYIIVSDYTQWGVIHTPAVQNIGRTPLPDGRLRPRRCGLPGPGVADRGVPGRVRRVVVGPADGGPHQR